MLCLCSGNREARIIRKQYGVKPISSSQKVRAKFKVPSSRKSAKKKANVPPAKEIGAVDLNVPVGEAVAAITFSQIDKDVFNQVITRG